MKGTSLAFLAELVKLPIGARNAGSSGNIITALKMWHEIIQTIIDYKICLYLQ